MCVCCVQDERSFGQGHPRAASEIAADGRTAVEGGRDHL